MKIIKKGNKFIKIQETEMDRKALEEERALLQGRLKDLQDKIKEIDSLLK